MLYKKTELTQSVRVTAQVEDVRYLGVLFMSERRRGRTLTPLLLQCIVVNRELSIKAQLFK